MLNRFGIIILNVLILNGCMHPFNKVPVNAPSDDAAIKMAEASESISESMLEVARLEKVIIPEHIDNKYSIPNQSRLQISASVDWNGPIGEIIARIAKAAGFRLHVLGKESPVPVLVNLSARNQSLVSILRNIDYQAHQKAFIRVYPSRNIIELRYAKMYS